MKRGEAVKKKNILSVAVGEARETGFSLIELMVAMAVFLVIGGAAVSLVTNHSKLNNQTQTQVGLTMGLRNAVSLMEIDASNAGAGFFSTGANPADWPIGLTITNAPQPCNPAPASTTYGANCFDVLNIITTDSNVGSMHPVADVNTNTNNTVLIAPPAPMTAATFALFFKRNDELLWLKPGSPKSSLTTTTLSADGAVAGANVQLTFTSTDPAGINPNDFYKITQLGQDPGDTAPPLTVSFAAATDWILKLNAIQYSVDLTNPANPTLMRKQGTAALLTPGAGDVVAEQVIGFRVGASIRRANVDQPYTFKTTDYNQDWTEIRSIRVSVIGRTTPNQDGSDPFRNAFDNGAYRIQGISVTINPRNLSMND